MDKKYWNEMLQAYMDNELSPADRLAVETRMAKNPEMEIEMEQMKALKKRLTAFSDNISIQPQTIERLSKPFQKKPRPQKTWIGITLTLAAVTLLAVFIPDWRKVEDPYVLEQTELQGTLFCYGCEVANRLGMEKGHICKDGHRLGLVCADKKLWQFAQDEKGLNEQKNWALFNQAVIVRGSILKPEGLLFVEALETDKRKTAMRLDQLPIHVLAQKH